MLRPRPATAFSFRTGRSGAGGCVVAVDVGVLPAASVVVAVVPVVVVVVEVVVGGTVAGRFSGAGAAVPVAVESAAVRTPALVVRRSVAVLAPANTGAKATVTVQLAAAGTGAAVHVSPVTVELRGVRPDDVDRGDAQAAGRVREDERLLRARGRRRLAAEGRGGRSERRGRQRHAVGRRGRDEAPVDAGAVEAGAGDRTGVHVGPVQVVGVEGEPGRAGGARDEARIGGGAVEVRATDGVDAGLRPVEVVRVDGDAVRHRQAGDELVSTPVPSRLARPMVRALASAQ